MTDISILQKSYLLVPICLIISLVVTFLLNLVINKQDEQSTYIKTSLVTVVTATLLVYIHTLDHVVEQIITEMPPF